MPSSQNHIAVANTIPGWLRCTHLIQRCSSYRQLHIIHAIFLTHGFHLHTFPLSRLIFAACTLRNPFYASLILQHSPAPPNSFIFNSLIQAHARGPDPHRALHYFSLMLHSPPDPFSKPNHHTFPFALAACVAVPDFSFGVQIHGIVIKNGLAYSDHYVQTGVLRLYAQSWDGLSCARKVFDEIPQRDAVHVDVLMNGFLRCGLGFGALGVFKEMLADGLIPDKHVITTAITACSHAGALKEGAWIHMFLLDRYCGFLGDDFVCSSLISMYAKCGCIEEAVKVFDSVTERSLYLWAAMIGGFAVHGLANDAIWCLGRMKDEDGLQPDGIVILSVMAACAHAGLVDDGLKLLYEMSTRYDVVPEHEHYSCAVNMLCKVGRLSDALELIHQMPMRPLASVWGSLLTGCRIHNNVELAEVAVEGLQSLTGKGEDDEGVFVQMSNIYLNSNKLEDARRIRKLIGRSGIKKTPAFSEIEVNGEVSSFVAGDPVHPRLLDIWSILHMFRDHTGDGSVFEIEDFEVGVMDFG